MSNRDEIGHWRQWFRHKGTKYSGFGNHKLTLTRWSMLHEDKEIARLVWAPSGAPVQLSLDDPDLPATTKFQMGLDEPDRLVGMYEFSVPRLDIDPPEHVLLWKDDLKADAIKASRRKHAEVRKRDVRFLSIGLQGLYNYCTLFQVAYPDDLPRPGDPLGGYLSTILPTKALVRLVADQLS